MKMGLVGLKSGYPDMAIAEYIRIKIHILTAIRIYIYGDIGTDR